MLSYSTSAQKPSLICSINDISSRMLRRFVFWTALRARCVLDSNGLLGNSVGQWQDPRRPFRQRSARDSLDFVGTLFVHLQTHDIAKLAIRLPGLTDAGPGASILSPTMVRRYGVFRK